MGFNDDLKRRKDGSYILSHKTKKGKEGDCIECGQNPKSRDLLYKYNTEDVQMVRNHIEDNLRKYSSHSTMKPIWCKKCAALIEYRIKVKHEKNN
jgi:hypothetical protein